jgi:Holliday junction resolvase
MPINSKAKGARAERELANTLKDLFGWNARRTAQFCGDAGDSDVVIEELPEVFVEVKMVEALSIVPAMRKAIEQCKNKLPMICHRKKQSEWLVTVPLTRLIEIANMISRVGLVPPRTDDSKQSTEESS